MDILVLGGGASGMMAALAAAEGGAHSVTLLERQARLGRKLLVTGNGRCNLTHLDAGPAHYHGGDPAFCRGALEAFPVADTLAFFASLGLTTAAEDSGRVYPFSGQAGSVLDVLRFALERPGIRVCTGCEVTKLLQSRQGFRLKTSQGDFTGRRLIVAAGGAAGGKAGGSDAGCRLLMSLGHRCTPLRPALVQLTVAEDLVRSLKGVRAQAGLVLRRDGAAVAEGRGEVQFTEYGLSGPAIFDLSRDAAPGCQVVLDLLPCLTSEALEGQLVRRCAALPGHTAQDLLTGMVQTRLGQVIVKRAGIPLSAPLGQLTGEQRRAAAHLTRHFPLTCTGTRGMDSAQVTAGGMVTDEFDPHTLESRLVPGLYACGEVLDVDGDCGGFNLQWAWSSGRLAGLSAAREVEA